MSSFNARLATPAAAAADPSKHVNYSFGMVLGVDDFTQEFAYLSGRDRWLARDVLGYGTVAGLAVSVEKNSATGETEVVVAPGAALSPRGQLIRVAPTQCASLTKWLASERNVQRIRDRVGVPPVVPLRLYVVLCYRECPTDVVPIPGEPCRTEENATAPSRVQDDFLLELRFEPPEQTEEDALRDFIKWLNDHVEIADAPGPFATLDEFLQTLRRSAEQPASPVSPPDFMRDLSPPVPAHVRIAAADACSYLRAAFRVWTTELRTRWRAPNLDQFVTCTEAPATPPATDDAVLLAELEIPLNAEGRLREDIGVTKREERRPYLLHLRMLQEWLLCARFDQAAGAGTVFSPLSPLSPPAAAEAAHTFATLYLRSPTVIRAWLHHPKPLTVTGAAVRVEAAETPNPIAQQPASVTQLAANLNVFDMQLTGPLGPLSRVTVRFDATKIKESGAGGRTLLSVLNDHTGTFTLDRDGSTLLAFLGVDALALNDLSDVDANAPQNGHLLAFNGTQWVNVAPETISPRVLPLVTIQSLPNIPNQARFRLWFHLDIPTNRAAIPKIDPALALTFHSESAFAPDFFVPLAVTSITLEQGGRNSFVMAVPLAQADAMSNLRFDFNLEQIFVTLADQPNQPPITLAAWARQRNIRFIGYDGVRTVTVFV